MAPNGSFVAGSYCSPVLHMGSPRDLMFPKSLCSRGPMFPKLCLQSPVLLGPYVDDPKGATYTVDDVVGLNFIF